MAAESSPSTTTTTKRRKIPGAEFVEDVQTYLSQSNLDVHLRTGKFPDIEKCLDVVATLQAKKDTDEKLIADFAVSEGIYSRSRIQEMDGVSLFVVRCKRYAGIFSLEEATVLLQKTLENAKASLEVLLGDLQFLRDQVTIRRVTIARIYNWDVRQRRIRQPSGTPKDS